MVHNYSITGCVTMDVHCIIESQFYCVTIYKQHALMTCLKMESHGVLRCKSY
jgi:hypothetical protein